MMTALRAANALLDKDEYCLEYITSVKVYSVNRAKKWLIVCRLREDNLFLYS